MSATLKIITMGLWIAFSCFGEAGDPRLNDGGGSSGSVTLTPPPEITPSEMPKGTDRKSGASRANIGAIIAAAMQGMSCMMLMKEAMKQPPGSTERAMLMAMAMQQCAQAAQSAANAAENKDSGKAASGADTPKMAQMKAQPFKAPESSNSKTTIPEVASSSKEEDDDDDEMIPQSQTPEIPSFETPSPTVAGTKDEPVWTGNLNLDQTSVPNAIERAKLGYDESGKSGTNPTPERQLGSGVAIATSKPSPEDGGKGGSGSMTMEQAKKRRAGSEEGGGSGGGGEGEKSSSDGGGGNPLEAMMAMLNPGAGQVDMPRSGEDVVVLNNAGDDSKNAPNIFEYATFRYRKAAHDEGRIKSTGISLKKAKVDDSTKMASSTPEAKVSHLGPTLGLAVPPAR